MAARFLGDHPRQQRMLRPVTFLVAVAAFGLSLGAIPPFAAFLLAVGAGYLAGKMNEAVHRSSLCSRILGGCALGILLVLGANLAFGMPYVVGGLGCLVLYVLM